MADAPDLTLFHSEDLENRLTNLANVINGITNITPTFNGSSSTDYLVTRNVKHISVNIRCKLTATLSANNNRVIIKNMPKPIRQIFFPIEIQGSSGGNFGWIDMSGNITIYTYIQIGTANIIIMSFGYDSE